MNWRQRALWAEAQLRAALFHQGDAARPISRRTSERSDMDPFAFQLGQQVAIAASGEQGDVVARSESLHAEPQYLLRYRAADGRATEAWWSQSALQHVG